MIDWTQKIDYGYKLWSERAMATWNRRMLSRLLFVLELIVVFYENLCPPWHSEVLASFVQLDDPACALMPNK